MRGQNYVFHNLSQEETVKIRQSVSENIMKFVNRLQEKFVNFIDLSQKTLNKIRQSKNLEFHECTLDFMFKKLSNVRMLYIDLYHGFILFFGLILPLDYHFKKQNSP